MIKTALVGIALATIFFGCANKDAFSEFELVKDEKLAFDNVELAKIRDAKGNLYGVVSAVHLNSVYPKRFDAESFYIIIYPKNRELLKGIRITLNDKLPFYMKKLPQKNEFSHLLRIQNGWSSYYLVKFPKTEDATLKLTTILGNDAKATVSFRKSQ